MSGVWYQVQGEPNQVSSRSWRQARSGHWSESFLPFWWCAICLLWLFKAFPTLPYAENTIFLLTQDCWCTEPQTTHCLTRPGAQPLRKKTGSTYALSTFGSGLHFSCVLNNRTIFLCRKIPTGIKLPYVEEHFILVSYFVFFTILRPATDSH